MVAKRKLFFKVLILAIFFLVLFLLRPLIFWTTKLGDGYKISYPTGWNVQQVDEQTLVISNLSGELSPQDYRLGEKASVKVTKIRRDKPELMSVLVEQTKTLPGETKHEEREKKIDGFSAVELSFDRRTERNVYFIFQVFLFVEDKDYVYRVLGSSVRSNPIEEAFYRLIVRKVVNSFTPQ